jgi:hypothetical protein
MAGGVTGLEPFCVERAEGDWLAEVSLCAVERGKGIGCEAADGGDRDLSGMFRRRKHGSQSTGMAAGVKLRSREAVRLFPQGFTRRRQPR